MTDNSQHIVIIYITYEEFENNRGILDIIWGILRDLQVKYPWMEVQDGKNAHHTWTSDPLWNPEADPQEYSSSTDALKVWDVKINMAKLTEGNSHLRFLDAPLFINDALKPLNVNLTINYYDGYGHGTMFLGSKSKEEEFEAIKTVLYGVINDIIAWQKYDDSGTYDKMMRGTKLEKRINKIAKTLKIE